MGVVRAMLDADDMQQHDRLLSLAGALGRHTGKEAWVQVIAMKQLPLGGGKRVEHLAERHGIRLAGTGPVTECAAGPDDHTVVSTWETYRRVSQSLPTGCHDRIVLYASAISHRWLETTPFRFMAYRDITRVVTSDSLDFAELSRESGVGRHVTLGMPYDPLAARRAREINRRFRMAVVALSDPGPWVDALEGVIGDVRIAEPGSRAARLLARRADVLLTEPSHQCKPEVLDGIVSQCLVLLAGSSEGCGPIVRRLSGKNPREVGSVAEMLAILTEPIEDRLDLIHAGAQGLERIYVTAEDNAAAEIAAGGAV